MEVKKELMTILIVIAISLIGCGTKTKMENTKPSNLELANAENVEIATFSGGCFWCMESGFEAQEGVISAVSGYTGGHVENPTYEEVSGGDTGHYEGVQVFYDKTKTSYKKMLESFWIQIDPTDAGGQFADRGSQYKTAIFYHNEEQRKLADESKKKIAEKFDKPIVTEIKKFEKFYEAEEYHQDYYKKQQLNYKTYAKLSGREAFIEENEKRMATSDDDIKSRLTDLQYKVTQQSGTEPSFNNKYWDNHEDGIYVDIVSGEPLFSSTDKFDSNTGWPSFTKPLESDNIVNKTDYKLIVPRTEVRSKGADSHLGHVFHDGPEPTGLRYCVNSASLNFIPVDKLEEEGYGKYLVLFEEK